MKPLGIYIHIPFCMRKCTYCDFLSFGVMTDGAKSKTDCIGKSNIQIKTYIDALCREIYSFKSPDMQNEAKNRDINENSCIKTNVDDKTEKTVEYIVDTIFIGGGTPSLLSPEQVKGILGAVQSRFQVAENAEISMESNPGSFDQKAGTGLDERDAKITARLSAYREAGINRLSIGAQSLHGDILRFLGRIHTKEQFFECYLGARHAGFDNINIDMMFGIPNMSFEAWRKDISRIAALQPEHISFYSLNIEEGTPLWQLREHGAFEELDHDEDRRMYGAALDILDSAGYEHYEISNAAKPGRACRHNLKYWSMEEYIGFGLGACSYLRFGKDRTGNRRADTQIMEDYIKSVQTKWQSNTIQDDISEYIFTGLRKIQGISRKDFQRRFGKDIDSLYEKQITKLCREGLLQAQDGYLRLTRHGIDISNRVFIEFV